MTRPDTAATAVRATDVWVTIGEAVIVALALTYVVTGSFVALIVWEIAATAYIGIGFFVVRRSSLRETGRAGARTGLLNTLSWIMPLVASIAGVSAAVAVLAAEPAVGIGVIGIVVSWILLQTGFARVYEAAHARLSGRGLRLPHVDEPDFGDFLYFSFGLGTFAGSDAEIHTRRMRWIVLVHSVASFFYNAVVVAIAIEVLQQIVATTP